MNASTVKVIGVSNETIFNARVWEEYDSAAEWCAKRGYKGVEGDPLSVFISSECYFEIRKDPEAFEQRVRDTAYELAMNSLNLPVED